MYLAKELACLQNKYMLLCDAVPAVYFIYVTRSDKTSLIAAKYTYSFYGTYHLF